MEDKGQTLYEWYAAAYQRLASIDYAFVDMAAWGQLTPREQNAWRHLAERVQTEEL